ncbi:MAG: DsbA family oxidoreductase [Alphaproteobacteria bacterium]|jgi:predicted DsbA family dithiol-disulfide isomerase|nr:DsbA family oxidoreductase [Alphaproteobacteria bacterium]
MQIDFISDTVCPWCFIGKRRLARAMAQRPDINFDVRFRPFRLDPTIPKGGLERRAYLTAKFGEKGGIEEAQRVIAAEGAKEGIEFDFAAIERAPNTLDSHRLIRWAAMTGVQDEVVERLFAAYFENGEDIGDIRILADIADVSGMDGAQIADMLEGDQDLALVEREDQLAREMGVTGVPAMIFANKVAVSGAREPEVLTMVIDKAREMAAQPDS